MESWLRSLGGEPGAFFSSPTGPLIVRHPLRAAHARSSHLPPRQSRLDKFCFPGRPAASRGKKGSPKRLRHLYVAPGFGDKSGSLGQRPRQPLASHFGSFDINFRALRSLVPPPQPSAASRSPRGIAVAGRPRLTPRPMSGGDPARVWFQALSSTPLTRPAWLVVSFP